MDVTDGLDDVGLVVEDELHGLELGDLLGFHLDLQIYGSLGERAF